MALTDEAKAAIGEAIRIVREDKFEQYARTTLANHKPKEDSKPPTNDGLEKPEDKDKPEPPPSKETEEVVEDKAGKRVDAWWGEIED